MSLLDPSVALYVATAVALIVWIALFFYLWMIDRRTRDLQRRLEEREQVREGRSAPQLQPVRNPRSGVGESESV